MSTARMASNGVGCGLVRFAMKHKAVVDENPALDKPTTEGDTNFFPGALAVRDVYTGRIKRL